MRFRVITFLMWCAGVIANSPELKLKLYDLIPAPVKKRVIALALRNYVTNHHYNEEILSALYYLPLFVTGEGRGRTVDQIAEELNMYLNTNFFTRGLEECRS